MFKCRIALAALLSSSAALSQSTSPIKLRIDLSDAPRHLIHVTEALPVHSAGLGPGDKLTAVNGQPYTADLLTNAVHDSKTIMAPIALTASREGETATYTIDYHGGEKYVALKRNRNPDALMEILSPLR
jgi:predicted metalloprotease with PDZ domain